MRHCILLWVAWIFAGACSYSQPQVADPDLVIETIYNASAARIVTFEFLHPDNPREILIAERETGRVRLVRDGAVQATLLDLAINYSGEQGLLGLALDPDFARNGYVYLYYSASSTSSDTNSMDQWAGNRVVRYRYDGTALVDPLVLLELPPDPGQPLSDRHQGGVLRFGPDGKLYISVGDMNRGTFSNPRLEQNTSDVAIAGCGGIYRLNPDGSLPADNPFIAYPDARIQRLWAYGIRNCFGFDFDALSGHLWITDNGPDVYDEINIVRCGFNGGWRKVMGPDARNALGSWSNNQSWDASDLVMLPNAYYEDPRFSWLTSIGITSLLFVRSARYAPNLRDQLLVADVDFSQVYLLPVSADRLDLVLTGDVADRVADTPSERDSFLWSWGWGVITEMKIGPDGFIYVCSLYSPRGIHRIRPSVPPEIVQGQVHLEGWLASPLHVPLTLRLLQNDQVVQTITTTLDAFGRFSERVDMPGDYRLKAKAGNYLSVTVPLVSIPARGYAYVPLTFSLNGDVNGDDVIDDADLLQVLFHFGEAGGSEDLDGDGTVDDADLLMVLFNFGASG